MLTCTSWTVIPDEIDIQDWDCGHYSSGSMEYENDEEEGRKMIHMQMRWRKEKRWGGYEEVETQEVQSTGSMVEK